MKINGDNNSDFGHVLEIALVRCRGRKDCKSDDEILAELRGK